jgi:two-component system KDP operon response regulator KdpE
MKDILIIEDDRSIQNFLKIALKTNGYEYSAAPNGLSGISMFLAEKPSLVLLDLGLPDIDGTEVLRQIRDTSDTPVLVISARGEEREKVAALDMGADDYITKPFYINELLARIRVAIRHKKAKTEAEDIFISERIQIDFGRRQVLVNGEEVHLTPIEYKILTLLVENSGKVLTHRHIQNEIWGSATTDDYQTLRVFMANIRRKIDSDTYGHRLITTEVGVGYKFNVDSMS